ncbi:hypothetical protein F5884DRAFT_19167 [Xylogone sp. PMI_703]|nr:hypothetical protein F5884DRAFT_19167 [Xylogone sp. PMI_703]
MPSALHAWRRLDWVSHMRPSPGPAPLVYPSCWILKSLCAPVLLYKYCGTIIRLSIRCAELAAPSIDLRSLSAVSSVIVAASGHPPYFLVAGCSFSYSHAHAAESLLRLIPPALYCYCTWIPNPSGRADQTARTVSGPADAAVPYVSVQDVRLCGCRSSRTELPSGWLGAYLLLQAIMLL